MPKIVDHDLYREELVDKCFALFSEKGYSNVTMRQIAAKAGISTGALYHYFPTKLAILEQMFGVLSRRDVEQAVRHAAITEVFEKRLELFFEFFLEKEANFQNLLLLSIDFLRNYDSEESERIVYQWVDYYLQSMKHYLGIPESLVMTIMIFFNGLVYQTKLFPKLVSSSRQLKIFKDILLSYIKEHAIDTTACVPSPFLQDTQPGGGGKKSGYHNPEQRRS